MDHNLPLQCCPASTQSCTQGSAFHKFGPARGFHARHELRFVVLVVAGKTHWRAHELRGESGLGRVLGRRADGDELGGRCVVHHERQHKRVGVDLHCCHLVLHLTHLSVDVLLVARRLEPQFEFLRGPGLVIGARLFESLDHWQQLLLQMRRQLGLCRVEGRRALQCFALPQRGLQDPLQLLVFFLLFLSRLLNARLRFVLLCFELGL